MSRPDLTSGYWQPLTFGMDAAGSGSSGRITAAELDITDAAVTYDITGTPDDAVYVLATYTNLVGTHFATVPAPPVGYTLEYAHEGNKIALVQTGGYDAWAGGAVFSEDDNGDGVANGMAWLLGAPDKDANAAPLLPVVSQSGGNLVLNFTCLKAANRGGAVLKVQSSSDLGLTDPWTSHEALVPDADATVNGVVFVTSPHANPDLINVQATIPSSPGTSLFTRLTSTP